MYIVFSLYIFIYLYIKYNVFELAFGEGQTATVQKR
jgi:hypothetical protein